MTTTLTSTRKDTEETKPKQTYPYLGVARGGNIVLFSGPEKGVVIHAGTGTLGYASEHFMENQFEPYNGEITLFNK